MGMIEIDMYGSFKQKHFETCAQHGGHVCAIKRAIEFLAQQLGTAIVMDANLIVQGELPLRSALDKDETMPPEVTRKMVNSAATAAVEYVEKLEAERSRLVDLIQRLYDYGTWAEPEGWKACAEAGEFLRKKRGNMGAVDVTLV